MKLLLVETDVPLPIIIKLRARRAKRANTRPTPENRALRRQLASATDEEILASPPELRAAAAASRRALRCDPPPVQIPGYPSLKSGIPAHRTRRATLPRRPSDPAEDRYVFAYTITFENISTVAAQVISRHWIITDANAHVQEVRRPRASSASSRS